MKLNNICPFNKYTLYQKYDNSRSENIIIYLKFVSLAANINLYSIKISYTLLKNDLRKRRKTSKNFEFPCFSFFRDRGFFTPFACKWFVLVVA